MFESESRARFEAWLTDGIVAKAPKGGGFEVISVEEAKARVERLIHQEDYSGAKELARAIRQPTSFLGKTRRKSLRVSLAVYIKLVELALKSRLSLNDVLSRLVVNDLKKAIAKVSRKEKVNREKLGLLFSALSALEKEGSSDVIKDKSEELSGFRTLGFLKRIPDSYGIQFRREPEKWIEIARQLEDEAIEEFISEHEDEVPRDVLQRYIELAYLEDLFEQELEACGPFELSLGKDGRLYTRVTWEPLCIAGGEDHRDVIIKEFGEEAAGQLERTVGSWVFSDDEYMRYDPIELFYATLEIDGEGKILINGSAVEEVEKEIDKFFETYTEDAEKVKKEVTDALRRGDMLKVEELMGELEQRKRDFEWGRFLLDLLIGLSRGKTQVVSFSAPDCLIALWEAYGDTDLKGIFAPEESDQR